MRTLLFTGYNDVYAPLAELTAPLMSRYAARHGYIFDYYQDCSLPVSCLPLGVPNRIYWTGVAGALSKLRNEGFERVIYLDVDQMITGDLQLLEKPYAQYGFNISRDWGLDATEFWHISACGFVAHRDCIPLLEEVLSMEPAWREKPFPEQGPLRDVIQRRVDNANPQTPVMVHPRRMLNAVPKEVHSTVQEPWQPGDFAAHLTNLPLERRIELFHEIKKQAGI